MGSKEDSDWRNLRGLGVEEPEGPYTLHRVANAIFAVCQLAAMICHIICFGVLLSKINELEEKIGRAPEGQEVCIFYMKATKFNNTDVLEYNEGHTCAFIVFTSIGLAILAAVMLIFLIVRIIFIKKMNFIGLFDVIEVAIAIVLTFIVSVTISIGRTVTCSAATKLPNIDTCTGLELQPYNRDHPRVQLYSAMKSTETSSWVAFLFLLVVAVISALRTILWIRKWLRNRNLYSPNVLINSEEVPSAEEVDKTPAAI